MYCTRLEPSDGTGGGGSWKPRLSGPKSERRVTNALSGVRCALLSLKQRAASAARPPVKVRWHSRASLRRDELIIGYPTDRQGHDRGFFVGKGIRRYLVKSSFDFRTPTCLQSSTTVGTVLVLYFDAIILLLQYTVRHLPSATWCCINTALP